MKLVFMGTPDFALVTLKTPVRFGDEDNDPIDILITMAAVDAKTHRHQPRRSSRVDHALRLRSSRPG